MDSCYPRFTAEHRLGHEACTHNKGHLLYQIENHEVRCWLCGIGDRRKISQGAAFRSWVTRKEGHVNPQLLQGIQVWQWEWHHGNSKGFLSLTGHALSNGLDKCTCKSDSTNRPSTRTTFKSPLIFPRKVLSHLGLKTCTAPQRWKGFSKRS